MKRKRERRADNALDEMADLVYGVEASQQELRAMVEARFQALEGQNVQVLTFLQCQSQHSPFSVSAEDGCPSGGAAPPFGQREQAAHLGMESSGFAG